MKVFKLEFRYFSGADWNWCDVEIIATTMEELKSTFMLECSDINQTEHDFSAEPPIRKNTTAEELFEKNISRIVEEELTFPIITRNLDRD